LGGEAAAMTDTNAKFDIMIVDDTPENLHLLRDMLSSRYKVRTIPNGKLALNAVKIKPPDLVLLDINMPEMDGYEVCRRLKEDRELADIPIVFISAMTETLDKIKAFAAGGVDYVTKPFQCEEVEARVSTHLKIRQLQISLEDTNRELAANYSKLRELESLREDLSNMIVHDIRNLLAPLKMTLNTFAYPHTELPKADILRMSRRSLACCNMMEEMATMIVDISRLEQNKLPVKYEKIDFSAIVRDSVAMKGDISDSRKLSLHIADGTHLEIGCDPDLIRRVIINLLANAMKYTPVDKPVDITVTASNDSVKCAISDKGPGIPAEFHEKIFSKFAQGDLKKQHKFHSSGLGLAFCDLAIKAHGGKIGVDSSAGKGSTFWFSLPKK
jgi:two-component system, sensor histidine kinase and response regulator